MTERAPAGRGQITPRMVDLFRASVPSIRRTGIAGLTAGVATLAACLLAIGALWPKIAAAPALRSVLWTLGCVGGFAFLTGLGLLELAGAYVRVSRGIGDCSPAVEKALRALRHFWLLACVLLALVAVRAGLTLSSGVMGSFELPRLEPSPSLPDPFGSLRAPRAAALVAKRTPVWMPPPAEVSLAGRALGWDDLPTACAIAAPEFFCLLNREGEMLFGDARRKVSREVTMEVKASGAEPRFKVEVRSGVTGIWLATPQGVPYRPLLYTGATGQLENFAHPYLSTSDSVKSGRFRILEVEAGPDGAPTRLVVDFELTHPDGWVETGRFSARVRPSEP